jgi:hypothetical protein
VSVIVGPAVPRQASRTRPAFRAHYALLQEIHGDPDVDPADVAIVELIIPNHGIEWACTRTGSAFTRHRNQWPDLRWLRSLSATTPDHRVQTSATDGEQKDCATPIVRFSKYRASTTLLDRAS